ncbi:MAG: EAL domain-containing response regulator [Natronospirillum sp.]
MAVFSHLNVLVVDDEAFARDVISATLSHLQIQTIQTAASGEEAIQILTKTPHQIDILLCDLHMPGMDGVELLRHLDELDFHGGIIVISGADERVLRAAISLARAHFLNLLGSLQKPVSAGSLAVFLRQYETVHRHNLPDPGGYLLTTAEFQQGLTDGHLNLFYQPQVDMQTGQILGVEALARWQHPTHGLLPPSAFVPLAEKSDLIIPFTHAVLALALAQAAAWHKAGLTHRMAINISAAALPRIDLPERLTDGCDGYGLPHDSIVLELTETQLDQDRLLNLEVLTRVRLQNFSLSIDDFGTGYSSLDRLKHAPYDELKIDGGFVHGAAYDSAARVILESSIALGNQLSLRVLAEGVEDGEDWQLAADLGCHLAQGFFIAHPMSALDLDHWLANWQGLESLAL